MLTKITEAEENQLIGKFMVNALSQEEIIQLMYQMNLMRDLLDQCDYGDFFGTEGWRRQVYND